MRAVDPTERSYDEAMLSEDESRSRVVAIENILTITMQGNLSTNLLCRVEEDIVDVGRWVCHGK